MKLISRKLHYFNNLITEIKHITEMDEKIKNNKQIGKLTLESSKKYNKTHKKSTYLLLYNDIF